MTKLDVKKCMLSSENIAETLAISALWVEGDLKSGKMNTTVSALLFGFFRAHL